MTYSITLKVIDRDTFLIVNYDETDYNVTDHVRIQEAVELLLVSISKPNSLRVNFEHIDDRNKDVTISCRVKDNVPLSTVGGTIALVEKQLLKGGK